MQQRLTFWLIFFHLAVSGVPALANAVVPNAVPGEFRHGAYPMLGYKDGDWTHVGVDLASPCGSRIFAFADGTVVDVINERSDPDFEELGFMMLIAHPASLIGKPFHTFYLHMQKAPAVDVGETVAGGVTEIGRVGSTGHARSCYTHLEIRNFPSRLHPEWKSLFGKGDQRSSELLEQSWQDPLPLLERYAEGLSTSPPEKNAHAVTSPRASSSATAGDRRADVARGAAQPPAAAAQRTGPPSAQETAEVAGLLPTERQQLWPSTGGTEIWSDRTCNEFGWIGMINPAGGFFFSGDSVFIRPAEFAEEQAEVAAEAREGERAQGSWQAELRKSGVQCTALPPQYYAMYGEAIALFQSAGGIVSACMSEKRSACIQSAFSFADVTGNGSLTVAEIARVIRALGFFVAYGAVEHERPGQPVSLDKLHAAVAVAGLLSPIMAKEFISAIDFNDDGAASLEELVQDRGPDQMIGAMGTVASTSTQLALKQLLGVLLSGAKGLSGIFEGLF